MFVLPLEKLSGMLYCKTEVINMVVCNLRTLAAERELSLSRIAVEAGISRTTLSGLVNHRWKGIQADTISNLCAYLGITAGDLLSVYPFDIIVDSCGYLEEYPRFAFDIIWHEVQKGNKLYTWTAEVIEETPRTLSVFMDKMDEAPTAALKALPPYALRAVKAILVEEVSKTTRQDNIFIVFDWEIR